MKHTADRSVLVVAAAAATLRVRAAGAPPAGRVRRPTRTGQEARRTGAGRRPTSTG